LQGYEANGKSTPPPTPPGRRPAPAVSGCAKPKKDNAGLPGGSPIAGGSLGAGAVTTPQQLAEQPGGIETVRIAYNLLINKYYKPVKSNDLLRAAWEGTVQELLRQGGSDTGNAPKLTGDKDADFRAFATSFNAAATRGDKAQYAFSAVQSMVQSLHDDHTYFLAPQEYKQRQAQFLAGGSQSIFSSQLLPGGIGYIKLSIFPAGYAKLPDGKTLAEEIDMTLENFEKSGVKGWVVDLRNDPGGHTESIATLVGRFLADGIVEVSVDGKGQRLEMPVDGHYFAHQHPLAMLINGQSGSAAEISASIATVPAPRPRAPRAT